MHIKTEEAGPCRRKLTLTAAPDEVAPVFDAATADIGRQAQVDGFRPGRVPRDVVALKFRSAIQSRCLKDMLAKMIGAIDKHLGDRLLRILEVRVTSGPDPLLGMEAIATVDTHPDFTLPEYRGIPVSNPPTTVTDEAVESMIQRIREHEARTIDVTDRPVQPGDVVQVDADGAYEGRPVETMSPRTRGLGHLSRHWTPAADGGFPPGMGMALTGAAIGDTREVAVSFPDTFEVAELAGRTVNYRTTVTGIRMPVLPEIDQAFCRRHGASSIDELRRQIRQALERELEDARRERQYAEIMDHLVARTPMDLPQSFVDEETRRRTERIVRAGLSQGLSEDAIRAEGTRIEESARRSAQRLVQQTFLLREIAKAENIEVSDEELDAAIRDLAAREGRPPGDVAAALRRTGAHADLREDLRARKTLARLLSLARLTEGAPA